MLLNWIWTLFFIFEYSLNIRKITTNAGRLTYKQKRQTKKLIKHKDKKVEKLNKAIKNASDTVSICVTRTCTYTILYMQYLWQYEHLFSCTCRRHKYERTKFFFCKKRRQTDKSIEGWGGLGIFMYVGPEWLLILD
jgi:hypothetical protein